jgi:hypothetical protein
MVFSTESATFKSPTQRAGSSNLALSGLSNPLTAVLNSYLNLRMFFDECNQVVNVACE